MPKPVIWLFNGKWWCGRYQGIMRIPVADILGSGDSPRQAYLAWVRCKWGTARKIVSQRKNSRCISAAQQSVNGAIVDFGDWKFGFLMALAIGLTGLAFFLGCVVMGGEHA